MPTTEELKRLVGVAEISKLKMLGVGLEVDRVLGRRVLVKDVEPETEMDRLEKEGLLHIPKSAKEANTPRASTGVVVKVGDGFGAAADIRPGGPWISPSPVGEGDMILFSKYAGVTFAVDKESGYRIVDENEIICTFKRSAKSDVMVLPVKEEE